MLPTVEPVDVEVVHNEDKHALKPDRQLSNVMPTGDSGCLIHSTNDAVDQDPKDIALNERIPYEIIHKATTKQLLMFRLRHDTFEEYDHNGADHCEEKRPMR